VLEVVADSIYSTYFAQSQYATLHLRPSITVKNTGVSTITSFKINSYLNPSMSCGIYVYQENITGVSIPPGGSLTVSGKSFAVHGVPVTGPSPLPKFEKFCFYITLPNGEVDKTFEDNELCNSFGFIITSLNENPAVVSNLSVFPNPASVSVHVKASEQVKLVRIVNALGAVVAEHSCSSNEIEIETRHLSTGIYFLHIYGENGSAVKKLIRD